MVTWSCALERLWLVQATETEVYLSPSAGDGCRGSQITKIHEAVPRSLFHQSLNDNAPGWGLLHRFRKSKYPHFTSS